ncbi:hypothetical protein CTI14_52990, partial [Methylobacterium radiotolerans]
LMDQRARTFDSAEPHPLARDVVSYLRSRPWVDQAAVRMRDQGQVSISRRSWCRIIVASVRPSLTAASEGIADLDWKVQDVVIVPVSWTSGPAPSTARSRIPWPAMSSPTCAAAPGWI